MASTTIADVRTVGINVTDQEAALRFFVDTLGFEKRLDAALSPTMRWIEVVAPGATTSIALNLADTPNGGTDTGVRFTVPDAATEHAAMVINGVVVSELLLWDDVPPMFSFNDPDGNRFYVVEDQP